MFSKLAMLYTKLQIKPIKNTLRRILLPHVSKLFYIQVGAVLLIVAGCSLEKKSGLNRNLQNLTAKYNILFNANVLLREKQDAYAAAYVDDYSELLAVYRDTTTQSAEPDPDLELVKTKANNIISLKEQSHYVGNGYLLLAKANYLQANYFDAVEYSSYVIRSFPENKELQTEATVWKARALLYLKKNEEAKHVLDTALLNIDPKKKPDANIYATRLQYDINTQNYAEGEEMAKQAIEYSRNSMERLRWTFILGQLQELNNKPGDAIASYARVANSNVAFNMAFNAQLNRIRIEDQQNGVKISRIDRLRSLLRNSNNKEFIDQIYFQIAEMQMIDKDIDKAINNYNLSVRYSATNQAQKSLSYLRLADIYFKNKADYAKAKNYYDSTLITMSPNYIGYASIKKKADNLQLLADRLQTIAREDTLQMLARMDEAARNKKIDEMVNRNTLQQQAAAVSVANANVDPFVNDVASPQQSTPNGSSFYFYNSNAVSTGFTDFKRVWGNRRLEDNWRRGSRSGGDIAANTPAPTTPQNTDPDALPDPLKRSPDQVDATQFRQDIIQNLPLNAALLAQSNDRIYSAYLDIANFYRDVLEDRKEAIAVYETLTKRFPNNPNAAAVYYNLYRLYSEQDAARSDQYKAILLRDYKETPFAKTILDPDYSRRLSNEDNGFSILYNKIYDLYVSRQYGQVITQAATLLQQYPNNRYAAQLQYLKAFAAGHQEKLAPFQADLQSIASTYPDDKLITPLVNQHLAYINVNQAELAARPVVLTEKDANEPGFTIPIVYQQKTEYRYPSLGETEVVPDVRKPEAKPVENLQAAQNINQKPAISNKTDLPKNINAPSIVPKTEPLAPAIAETPAPVVAPARKPTYAFNERDSTNYYFVVNVSSGTTNVASSRFGIGQFNRVNFERDAIKHQLRTAGPDNQLIFVGRFYNLNNVKDYARAIVPLLPDIMKVPKDKYSFFIITQENLNKLADKKTLDSYIEYYQQNF